MIYYGPLQFYNSKYKEKTNTIYCATYSLDSCPFRMDNAFLNISIDQLCIIKTLWLLLQTLLVQTPILQLDSIVEHRIDMRSLFVSW